MSARIGAVIALDGEKEFKKAVSSINKEVKNLESESKLLKEQFKEQEGSMEALRAKHDLLRRTLEVHQKKVDEVNNGLQHAREVYEQTGNKLGELEEVYNQARQRMEEMEQGADTTAEALEEQRKEVERLSQNLEKSRDNYRRAGERVLSWETDLNRARTALVHTNNELRENEAAMEAAGQETADCAEEMEELAQSAQEAASSAGDMEAVFTGSLAASAVEAVTEKVVELAQAAAETAKEMEAAQQQVTASTGSAAAEVQKYGEIMKELYSNNYGESFEDIGEAIGTIKRNLGDISSEELKNVAEDAITLRDTFEMDYQEQIRAVKMLMDSFGVSSKQAYNLIAQGAQSGLNKNDDLLDTINEYSVHYKNMGVSAEGFFNSLTNGTAAGTFSVDKLGDAYKEFGIRVKDTAASTTEGFELLGLDADTMREKFAAGGESAKAATDETLQALFSMEDQVAQNQAGVDLFGTMWEDMGIDAVKALTDVDGSISSARNSMESIKEIKYSDIGSQIAEVSREIEMKLVEPLEKKWLPAVRDGLEFVSDHMEVIGAGLTGLAGAAAIWKLAHTQAGEAVIKVLKALIFTRAADTTATVTQTAAQGAQTLATKVATAAQTAYNTVMSMNPIAKVLLALAAAVTAYKLFSKAVEHAKEEIINSDEELKKSRETVDELGQEVDELKNSAEEARKARESSIEGIQAEYNAYDELASKLVDLSEKENLSNGEKALMKTYVDQLNEAMPELNLSIDENTGKLNQNEESIRKIIEANKERLIVEAQESMLGEILQEQMRAEIDVAKIQNEREAVSGKLKATEEQLADTEKKVKSEMNDYGTATMEAGQKQSELGVKTKECKDQLEKLDGQMADAKKVAEDAKAEYDLVAQAVSNVAEQNGVMGASAEENSGSAAMAAREVAEAHKEMEDGIRQSLEGTASVFEEFNAGQEISTDKMLQNLNSQEKGLTEWKDNLTILAGAAGSGMTEEFFQYLVEMGPQGANAVAELSKAFQNGEPQFKEICDKYQTVMMMQDDTASEITKSFYDTGLNATKGATQGINEGTPEAEQASRNSGDRVADAYKDSLQTHSPSRRMRDEVGVQIPRGVAEGIRAATPEAVAAAKEMSDKVTKAAKGALDIHSPSKKMRKEVGAMTARGVALGIKDGIPEVEKSTREMTKSIYQQTTEWIAALRKKRKVSAKEEQEYWKEMLQMVKKGSEDYKKIQKKIQELTIKKALEKAGDFGVSKKDKEGAVKSAEEYAQDVLEAATSWFSEYKKQHDATLKDEVAFWQKVQRQLKKGTAAYREATKNLRDAKKDLKEEQKNEKEAKEAAKKTAAQEKLSASDKLLSQYKVYYKMSAKAEVDYWNIVRKQFKKGTEERIEADKKYYDAKENLNGQLENLEEEYAQSCKEVQEQLKDDIQSLTDAYNDAVKERADAIYSSFGLFDEFKSESESGTTLLYNLKTQVAGLADWELKLEELAGRGLPTELMDELKEMGPQASAALHALNSLTDDQLKEYVSLWQQKKDLSQSQAVKDNEPLREETKQKIAELKAAAKEELEKLKQTYKEAVAEIKESISDSLKEIAKNAKKTGEDTTAELVAGIKEVSKSADTKKKVEESRENIGKNLGKLPKAGKVIGKNTLEGILAGLTDKKTIQKSAKQFIDDLKKEMQKAAEIHSPSKLFKREIGLQLPAGVGEGIEEGTKGAKKKSAAMVKSLVGTYKDQIKAQELILIEERDKLGAASAIQATNRLVGVQAQNRINVAVDNGDMCSLMSQILSVMQQYIPQMAEKQLVMDTGQTVGALSDGMSAEFAMMARRLKR